MNEKDFSNAVSELDEKYYSEALSFKKKKNSAPKWIAAAAACLCVAAVGAGFALNGRKPAAALPAESTAEQTASFSSDCNVSKSIAQTVSLDGESYFVCGTGEAEVLAECGLPESLSASLAGKHIAYLFFDEETEEYVPKEDGNEVDGELFEYAPAPNKNVYIVSFGESYYAAIRHDDNGYHGLND